MAMAPFIWGNGGEQLTPQQVERRRIAALLQSQRASDTSPAGDWTVAAARGLNGFLAGRTERNADRQENAGLASADAAIQGNPVLSALMGGQQMPAMAPAQGEGGIPVPSAPVQGGGDPTLDLIKGFEGFRETPYWDVNAFRTGYGSDTITTADGRVIPVSEGMQVSRADAERDLQRRVSTEFQPRAQQAAGAAWDTLGAPQRAALTSIAYNYGSVPETVAQALQSGGDVGAAIMSLAGHNDGINADRRAKEAALFSGMATPSAGGVAGNMPQAPSGVVAALTAAQSNPWVAQKYGPVIDALMQQEMGRQDASYQQTLAQQDPMYQAQLQAAQIANQQAMMPQAPELINAGGGNLYDPATGQWVIAPRGPQEPMSGLGKLEADRAAGLISDEAYQAELASMAPQGMSIESDGAGGFRMVQGAGAGDTRPFTEGQSKDVVYSTRARGALDVLDPIADSLASRGDRIRDAVPFGFGREGQDPNYQVAQNAGNEFLQAILRKDTGAAITEQEQSLYGVTYLPQPGDGPEVLAQKKAARQRALAAIEGGMSPSQMIAQERALASSGQAAAPAPAATATPAPARDFRAMTPGELATIDLGTLSDAELDAYLEATQ